MTSAEQLGLGPDDLAFYFASDMGIEAGDLGQFLQRAAVVAREAGAELRVTALEPGSLSVIMKAVRRTRVGRAAEREFYKAPVATTGAAVGIVGAVAAAIVFAMSPDEAGPTPLGKAGAAVVERHHVERIEVVTVHQTFVVMDPARAREVRAAERRARRGPPRLTGPDMAAIADDGRRGALTGSVHAVAGELHFRPDGYRFLVPIDIDRSDAAEDLYPEAHFRVSAALQTRRGQPHAIVIRRADRI